MKGPHGGPGVLPGTLSTAQRCAVWPSAERLSAHPGKTAVQPLMSLICPGKGACYAIIRRLRQESDGRIRAKDQAFTSTLPSGISSPSTPLSHGIPRYPTVKHGKTRSPGPYSYF